MDNKLIIVQSEGRQAFDLAFKLFFITSGDIEGEPRLKATHYTDDHYKGLTLYWHDSGSVNPIKLPVALNWKAAADLAWEWLLSQPETNYKQPYDGDGSSGHGFKLSNEISASDGWSYEILTVQPIFAWYGK